MNHTNSRTRWVHRVIVCVLVAVFALPAGALLWLATAGTPSFGTSYPVLNTSSSTDLTTQTAKIKEELWVRRIVQGADLIYQDNPFAEMMGEGDVGKAIVKLTDTAVVAGSTVNVTTFGGFAGPGVSGEGTRTGQGQKFQVGSFPVKIGRRWFGIGYTGVARDETMLGGRKDKVTNDGLRNMHAKGRNDDICMLLIAGATTLANLTYPDAVTTRAGLLSASVFSTGLITKVKTKLSSKGGMPMSLGPKDSGDSRSKRFVIISPHTALATLDTEAAYTDARTNGGVRGDGNPMFTGEYTEWNGMGLYRWQHVDHANWGPIGSPFMARAFTGAALTGADTGSIVKGGGSAIAAAALPAPQYTQFFSNAPYVYHNTNAIVADVATLRYIKIINIDGSGYGRYSYKVNDGNQITIFARVAGGTQTNTHPIGSLVVETNANGVPFARSIAFGQQIVAVGQGRIDGSTENASMGQRTEEIRNHKMDIEIGAEAAWGCDLIKRVDGAMPGWVMIEHAIAVEGDTQAPVT